MVRRRSGFKLTGVDYRARIVLMWINGVSPHEIAQKTETSVSTVYRWIRRWRRESNFTLRDYNCFPGIIPRVPDPLDAQPNSTPFPAIMVDVAHIFQVCCTQNTPLYGFLKTDKNYCTPAFNECNLGCIATTSGLKRNESNNKAKNSLSEHPGASWRWWLTTIYPSLPSVL